MPRSLLRNFEDEEGKLYVYDKLRMKSFVSNSDNAGHENNFNSVKTDGKKINFEDHFQEIDSIVGQLVIKINNLSTHFDFTHDELFQLAYITCVQQIRTKLSRTNIVEFSKDINEWMNETYPVEKTVEENKKYLISDDQSKIISMFPMENMEERVLLLLQRGMLLFRTKEEFPFWISDNPVIMDNPFPYGRRGLQVPGTDVYFPVSKRLLLVFVCKTTCEYIYENYWKVALLNEPIPYSLSAYFDGIYKNKIIDLEQKYVEYYNSLQVQCSSRFLYSCSGDFSLAHEMISESPALKEIKKTIGIEKDGPKFPSMPQGEHIVFFLTNKHFMSTVKLEDQTSVVIFFCDDTKVLSLVNSNTSIDSIEIYKDQFRIRLMRDVIIEIVDKSEKKYLIKHRDPAFEKILQLVKKEKKPE